MRNQIVTYELPCSELKSRYSQVFNFLSVPPEQTFSSAIDEFFIYDISHFEEQKGWDFLFDLCLKNNSSELVAFSTQFEENKEANIPIIEIPAILRTEQFDLWFSDVYWAENSFSDIKISLLTVFNGGQITSTSINWGIYFNQEYDYALLGVQKEVNLPESFYVLPQLSYEEFKNDFFVSGSKKEEAIFLEKFKHNYTKV
ncbi:hypothetical protein [Listeria costaricensis]|uniref:hypothetical protein n=1 Tax=Listeria costaricensis TaxID=2026604 RepID=UPI000C072621|nr:hypothetical protein [Listeria costaricensis]